MYTVFGTLKILKIIFHIIVSEKDILWFPNPSDLTS